VTAGSDSSKRSKLGAPYPAISVMPPTDVARARFRRRHQRQPLRADRPFDVRRCLGRHAEVPDTTSGDHGDYSLIRATTRSWRWLMPLPITASMRGSAVAALLSHWQLRQYQPFRHDLLQRSTSVWRGRLAVRSGTHYVS